MTAIVSTIRPRPAHQPGGASSPGTPRYAVDPDQLTVLASGLRRVEGAIQDLGRLEIADPATLGSPLLIAELGEFGRSWSVARTRLGHELDLLARAADVAAHAYATVDGNVLTALAGAAGSGR